MGVTGCERHADAVEAKSVCDVTMCRRKNRDILVDSQGLLLHAIVHAADIQDRDGGVLLMANVFGPYPFLLKLYADGGY
jgi:hypothetical protein